VVLAGSHSSYRSDIDGLRAVAVLSVVAFHAFPGALPGGFVGVDIFFVISGYLIGGILIRGFDAGTFSAVDFYSRRIKRIFPALILVIGFCMLVGWRVLLSSEYRSLALEAAGGAASVANIVLWLQTGYFDTAAIFKPLLHLWSLGVEEQFYIALPLTLYIAYRLRWNVAIVCVVLGLLSFAANLSQVETDADAAFFLPHTRAWELLAGTVLAYVEHRRQRARPRRASVSNLFSAAGLALIAVSVVYLDRVQPYPGWRAVLPTCGAFLVIAAGGKSTLNRWLLSNRAMVSVGLISYPLYLWHWPLFSFGHIVALPATPSTANQAALVALSFVLATMTYWLIEKQVRYRKPIAVPAALVGLMLVVGTFSLVAFRENGFPSHVARFDRIERSITAWDYPRREDVKEHFRGIPVRRIASDSSKKVLYAGDSNMEQYWPRVEEDVRRSPHATKSAVFTTQPGCPPIPHVEELAHPNCTEFAHNVVAFAQDDNTIDTVVVASNWAGYLKFGKTYFFRDEAGAQTPITSPTGQSLAIRSLKRMLSDLVNSGKRVFLILNSPISLELDPRYLVNRSLAGFSARTGGLAKHELVSEGGDIKEQLLRAARDAGAKTIDPTDTVCSANFCAAWYEQSPMYKDSDHLSSAYVREHATFIDQTIELD
jgi:peptidoglycan/LPS O-acetylase OafA/YrhL